MGGVKPAPWWTHYPKAYWVEEDWQAWEKAGSPRVPRHLELQPPLPLEIGNTLPVPPPGPQLASGFRLFPKPRRRNASARSRAVDRLIEKYVGR